MTAPPPDVSPPRLARALLRRLAASTERDMLDGDLAELFAADLVNHGWWQARWKYRREVLSIVIRPLVWNGPEHATAMADGDSMMTMVYEVRQAVRTLRRQRTFTASALLVLTLGIGLITTTLAVVNVYLLRPLPIPEPDRLMAVAGPLMPTTVRPPEGLNTVDWRREFGDLFEHIVAWDLDAFTLVGEPHAETLLGAWVSPDYFDVAGVQPAMGRTLLGTDARPGAPRVAMISSRVWQARFAADPAIIGRTITTYSSDRPLDAEIFTIVGVLPQDFWFFSARFTDLLAPLPDAPRHPTFIRLRPNVTASDGEGAVAAIVGSLPGADSRWRVRLVPAAEQHVEPIRQTLVATTAAVTLVLLVTLATVAMLVMLRAIDREREVAIRTALGARRGRLARQLIMEGVVLAAAGGALGLVLASFSLAALAASIQRQLGTELPGGPSSLYLDGFTITQVATLVLMMGVVLGVVPLIATSGSRVMAGVRGGRSVTMSASRRRLRSVLVGAEVAMSLALIIGAALMIQSAMHLNRLTVGFDADRVMKAETMLSIRSYPEPAHRTAVVDRLLASVAAVPGVESVTAVFPFPFRATGTARWESGGVDQPLSLEAVEITVADRYFDALRIPVRAGRVFSAAEHARASGVAIVGAGLAARAWPGINPIGQRIRREAVGATRSPGPWLTVVGVVNETRQTLTAADPPELYVPYVQQPSRAPALLVRSAQDALPLLPSLRAAVARVDPEIALEEPDLLARLVAASTATHRFLALLLGGLAVFASLLAVFGVYGVIAFGLARRQHDIAMHLCFGARREAIVRMLLRQEGAMVVAGLAAGLGLAIGLSGAVAPQLHGIEPRDPLTFTVATVVLAAIASLAIAIPAARTARLDVIAALRRHTD